MRLKEKRNGEGNRLGDGTCSLREGSFNRSLDESTSAFEWLEGSQ